MKKTLAYLGALLMLFFTVSTAYGQTMSIPTVQSTPGASVQIPINANINNLGAAQLQISFDPAVFTPTGVTNQLSGFLESNIQTAGQITLAFATGSGLDVNGPAFVINGTYAGGSTAITFTGTQLVTNGNAVPISVSFTNGRLERVPLGPPSLTFGTVVPADGATTVTVPLMANNLQDIGSIDLTGMYDGAVLDFQNVLAGSVPAGLLLEANETAPGTLRILAAASGIELQGKLADLVFNYMGGSTAITGTATVLNSAFQNLNVPVIAGAVNGEPANQAPTFGAIIPNFTVKQGMTATYDVDATDPEDETLTYALVQGGNIATIDAMTGVITIAPGSANVGDYPLQVSVSDGANTVLSNVATVSVTIGNLPPVFDADLSDLEITAGETLTIDVSATDEEGDEITYAIVQGEEFASIDPMTGELTIAPMRSMEAGDYNLQVSATSNGVTVFSNVAIVTILEAPAMLGDVNLNGVVNQVDAVLVLQSEVGKATLSSLQRSVADVTGNGSVSALDASYILMYAAELITCFPAETNCSSKAGAAYASGTLGFGAVSAREGGYALPINVTGASGVLAMNLAVEIPQGVSFESVDSKLPRGWTMDYRLDGDNLVLALAGTSELAAGDFAAINFVGSANATFEGEGTLNEGDVQQLGAKQTGVDGSDLPDTFELGQNYPNPFNPSTTISFKLPEASQITVSVYDSRGRLVQDLVSGVKDAGTHTVEWNGRDSSGNSVASGVYFYQIKAGSFNQTKTMVLVK